MSGQNVDLFEFKFLTKLKQRNVFRVTAAYLGLAWLIVTVATDVGETFESVRRFVPWLIYVLAAGLPLVLIWSWISERRPSGSCSWIEPKGCLSSLARRLDLIILVIIALAVLALLADRWVFHRPTDESMLMLLAVVIVVLLTDRLIGARAAAPRTAAGTAAPAQPRVAISFPSSI